MLHASRMQVPQIPEPERRDRGRAELVLGALGSLVALAVPLLLLAAPRSEVMAVVGAPGEGLVELARVVARADGAILGPGGRDNVILARSDRAGFAGRLYAAGARLVVDAGGAEGCGRPPVRAVADVTPIPTRTAIR